MNKPPVVLSGTPTFGIGRLEFIHAHNGENDFMSVPFISDRDASKRI